MSADVESMAWNGEMPWHGLGNEVPEGVSTEDMLRAAGLDWSVRQVPLMMDLAPEGATDHEWQHTHRMALVRSTDDKILTITGEAWQPLQNADAMDFFRQYAAAGQMRLRTAGALRGGRLIWALASLEDGFTVSTGDRVDGYVLMVSPHEVGNAITIRTTTVRVVCANTLALALGRSTEHYRQDHRQTFDAEAAREAVERAHQQLGAQAAAAQDLHRLHLSDTTVREFYARLMVPEALAPAGGGEVLGALAAAANDAPQTVELANSDTWPTRMQAVYASYLSAPGAEAGTGWGVLNGVTHWADHVAGRTQESRLRRAWFGDTAALKLRAQAALLRMAA